MLEKTDIILLHRGYDKPSVSNLVASLRDLGISASEWSNHGTIRKKMIEYFSKDELRNICQDFHCNHESFPQDTLDNMAREMIIYFEKDGKLNQLIEHLGQLRGNADWNAVKFPDAATISTMAKCMALVADEDGNGPWTGVRQETLTELLSARFPAVVIGFSEFSGLMPKVLEGVMFFHIEDGDGNGELKRLAEHLLDKRSVLATSKEVIKVQVKEEKPTIGRVIDSWAMTSIKHKLHTISELIADDSNAYAATAAKIFGESQFSQGIPIMVELRWNRAYQSAVDRLFKIPSTSATLSQFEIQATDPPCPVPDGVISIKDKGLGSLLVSLAGHPAAEITVPDEETRRLVADALENHGRLGVSSVGGQSIPERLARIPFHGSALSLDQKSQYFYRNRDALYALLARFKIPGEPWLLPDSPPESRPSGASGQNENPMETLPVVAGHPNDEQIFSATGAYRQIPLNSASFMPDPNDQEAMDAIKALFGENPDLDMIRNVLAGIQKAQR